MEVLEGVGVLRTSQAVESPSASATATPTPSAASSTSQAASGVGGGVSRLVVAGSVGVNMVPAPQDGVVADADKCKPVQLSPSTVCSYRSTLDDPSRYLPCVGAGSPPLSLCVATDAAALASVRAQFGLSRLEYNASTARILVNDGRTVFRFSAPRGMTLYRVPQAFVNDYGGTVRSAAIHLHTHTLQGYTVGMLGAHEQKVQHKYGRLLSLVKYLNDQVQHFVWETLPVVDFVTEFVVANPDVKVLVPNSPAARVYLEQLWGPLGVSMDRLVVWDKGVR
jgi:hypothetical protein